MSKKIPVDRSKPDPKCLSCFGRGVWPEGLKLNPPLWIRLNNREGHPSAVACKMCWTNNERA